MITKNLHGAEPTAPGGSERPLPQVGDLFAKRYAIEAVLGQGGFGAVFRARDTQLEREVALKVLHRGTDEPVALARFLQEARAAAALASDHVAIVHEVGVDNAPYLVMELLRGRDLQDEIEARGRLPVDEAVTWVLQAMLGVAHAHAKNIVHRDLKPRNLFLADRDDGTTIVKVLDFGIAKSEDAAQLTQSGAALGTPRYMAPEQLRSSRSVDVRADIWALGVVLYELVTGKGIFDAESGLEFAAQIVADPHVPMRTRVPELPVALETVVDRCLAKEPIDRDPDLAALARSLAPFAPAAQQLVARIEHTLRNRTGEKVAAPARRTAHDATTRAAETVDEKRPKNRQALIAMLAGAGLVVGVVGAIIVTRGPGSRSSNAGSGAVALGSAPTPDTAVAATTPDAADAIDAAVASTPSDAAVVGAAPPRKKPVVVTQAEKDGIDQQCQSMGMNTPVFLVPGGGPAMWVCGRISLLGCAGLRRGCKDAISDDEKRACRDLIAKTVEAEVCK